MRENGSKIPFTKNESNAISIVFFKSKMEKSVPKKAHIYLKGFLSTIEVQLRSDLELYQIEIIYSVYWL